MTGFLREYLLSIVAVSLISSCLLSVVPKGSAHGTLQFLSGLLLILVTISPILDLEIVPFEIPDFEESPPTQEAGQEELLKSLITEEAQSYIWDKGRELGYDLDVEVTVGGSPPQPEKAVISGEISQYHREILSKDLEINLAIPRDRQEWRNDG